MPHVTLLQCIVVVVATLVASVLGGVAGYGPGLLVTPLLVPIVGAAAVVPTMSIASLLMNGSRLAVFRPHFDPRRAALVIVCALPTCLLAAYGYTRLNGQGVSILIGCVLILAVPVRYLLRRRQKLLTTPWLAASAAGFGLVMGGTSGSGVIDLAILLAAGLHGSAVIATDAGISMTLNVARITLFQSTGTLVPSTWIIALLIGLVSLPGAAIAKRIADRLPTQTHTTLLDGVVVMGGIAVIAQALF